MVNDDFLVVSKFYAYSGLDKETILSVLQRYEKTGFFISAYAFVRALGQK